LKVIIKKTLFYNFDTDVFMAVTECGKKITGENTTRISNKLEGFSFKIEATKINKNGQDIYQIKEIESIDSVLFSYLKNNIGHIRPTILREILIDYSEEDLINTIIENPIELTKYKYIGDAIAKKINKKWIDNFELFELSYPLAKLGLTENMLNRIFIYINNKKIKAKKYIEMFEKNPYILVDIDNVGFKTSDKIALKLGVNKKSNFRIEAAIKFSLNDTASGNGDTTISKENIYLKINELLELKIDEKFYEECLKSLIKNKEIVLLSEDFYSLKKIYEQEMFILETFSKMNKKKLIPLVENIDLYISEQEKKYHITLGEEQKQAIELLNTGVNAFALCGYAGTGKSTVSKIMLNLFTNKNILCTAVSGIATDRIRKASERPSVVMFSITNNFVRRGNKAINLDNIDVLLIDESSMVNNEQFYYILKKYENRLDKMKIILVGDNAQLPPIGPGNFFTDVVNLNLLPQVSLTTIYRQSKDMKLTTFAEAIRNGRIPSGYDGIYKDFLWYTQEVKDFWPRKKANDPTLDKDKKKNYFDIRKVIVDNYIKKVPKLYKEQQNWNDYVYDNQIITPMKRYTLGVEGINNEIQKKLADTSKKIIFGFNTFCLWDKVVHIKNKEIDTSTNPSLIRAKGSYLEKQKIFNGMLGMIVDIDTYGKKVWVYYPIEKIFCCYGMNDLKFLNLGYAITIHKSQGAEFGNIYMPMTYAHFIMLNHKLLYTAITRAKNKCTLVGEKSAFFYACKNNEKVKRISIIQINFLNFFDS